MGKPLLKTAILTSSRADFGIYLPLIQKLMAEKSISLDIIAFGTHLSPRYGNSLKQINDAGCHVAYSFDTAPESDTPGAIARSMAEVTAKLAGVWENSAYELVFALGDRYEMFAAVASAMPFNIKIAHIHGGETTLGAIDNAYRHSISQMSAWHFTCAEPYREKVCQLTGTNQHVYNTGALGIDNLNNLQLLDIEDFTTQFGINPGIPTLLITLHPETIGFEQNQRNTEEMLSALEQLTLFQQVFTMPNADTSGLLIRALIEAYAQGRDHVHLVENFGTLGYLSLMKHAVLMLGNSSSGFMEAAFFPKWVVNLGKRQDGRLRTPNIIDIDFDSILIKKAVLYAYETRPPVFEPVYGNGHAADKIVKILKDEFSLH